MDLTIVYKFQKKFFIAGRFRCPIAKAEDKISLLMERAETKDKLFIKDKYGAARLIKDFKMKDFYPIKKYFEYEGYEIEDSAIKKIKNKLGGAQIIWVNFEESQV